MSVVAANYAIRHCKLQDVAAKMVLTALAWKAPIETPHLTYMGNEQLRQETGLKSINGVKDALRRLVASSEVRIVEVGGRGQSTNYELVGVRRWLESNEVSASDISNGDTKPSESDANCQMPTVKCQHLTPIDKDSKTKDSASPAPAASQPSLPSSSPVRPPRKRTAPKQDVDISDLSLPHGTEFRNWWVRFMDYRKQPIKGRRSPLTKLAAELILEDLAQISEPDAMKALRDAITSSWIKPYTDRFERKTPASKVVPFKARASDDSYEREILRRVGGLKA